MQLPWLPERCAWFCLITFESQGQPETWNMAGFHQDSLNDWMSSGETPGLEKASPVMAHVSGLKECWWRNKKQDFLQEVLTSS